MAEAKKVQAKDFTNSAENLCNPEEVKVLLVNLHDQQLVLADQKAKLREQSKELVEEIEQTEAMIAAIELDLKGDTKLGIVGAIEQYGSFQDTENEHYAVRYRRMMSTYHVPPFKKWYEKYVSAVIEESVNVQALKGLIKGGLMTEDELKHKKVITEEAQYAYYIR